MGAMATEMFGGDFSYRRHQKRAVDFALDSFAEGKDVVIFEAPTGFGKSIVNIIIAYEYPKVFYTSPQVALVDQLSNDPMLKSHVDAVYGKSHYDCIIREEVSVDIAPCEKGIRCTKCQGRGGLAEGICRRCKGRGTVPYECRLAKPAQGQLPPRCPYYRDKWNASHGQVAVTTLAYMLLASTPFHEPLDEKWNLVKGRFPPRDLLIVDEAHGTADFASRFISLTLSQYTLRGLQTWKETWNKIEGTALSVKDERDVVKFLTKILLPELSMDIKGLEAVRLGTDKESERMKTLRDIERVKLLMSRVSMAIVDMKRGNPWAIDPKKEKRKLTLQPVLIGSFLKEHLWNRADQHLLSTATVLDRDLFLKELGLEDKGTAIMRIPSIFPPEKSPVIDATVGSLTRRQKQRNLPKALRALCRILDKEKGRGLVHCHSYENAVYIRQNIPSRYRHRLLFHESSNRSDILEKWLTDTKEDSVLVSVAMTEGLDLRDDLARWAVILKVPYPNLGDKRIARRLKLPDGEQWYRLTTLRTIVQGAGRIIRSEDDEGRVYVLDSAIHTLFRQTSEWTPEWFRRRMEAGGFHEGMEARRNP